MSRTGEEPQPETTTEVAGEQRGMSERTAKVVLFVVGLLAAWGILVAAPWIAYVVVGILLDRGWQKARAWIERRQGSDEDEQEPPAAAEDSLTRDRLTRALHAVGAPHAHTSALAAHLGTTNEHVRHALDDAGIPRSDGVRMKGRKVAVSPGVKRDDFPPLPSSDVADTQEGVLTSNNNSNNAFDLVDDDKNPVRTHVRWRAR